MCSGTCFSGWAVEVSTIVLVVVDACIILDACARDVDVEGKGLRKR